MQTTQTATVLPVDLGSHMSALETELVGLYEEAYARKVVEQDASEIWARINEILIQLNGRETVSTLDEGGETCENAYVITSLPFCETGNTSDNANNYQPLAADRCGSDPPGPSVPGDGRDVVYSYTPVEDEVVSISLCGSQYDTYLYIYANGCPGDPNAEFVCCSDDHAGGCPQGSGNLTSCCSNLTLSAGVTYYIFVDGWSSTSNGAYLFGMDNGIRCERCTPPPPPPCVECPDGAYHSVEQLVCQGGYTDVTNAGCIPGAPPLFEEIACNMVVCATAGTYQGVTGGPVQDVDYYTMTVAAQSESLYVGLFADAPGSWGIWRMDPSDLCGEWDPVHFATYVRCQTSAFDACVTPGLYVIGVIMNQDIACGTNYTLTTACLECPVPVGRCCYRTEDGPACADEWTRDECLTVQGLWTAGLTCEECCPTDFCVDPIVIPGVLEYTNTENSCCSVPVNFCVGRSGCDSDTCYSSERAVIYSFTIEQAAIMTLTASGPGDNQIMVFTDCNDPQGSCVASADIAEIGGNNPFLGAPEVLTDLNLAAGTYYVATAHYFWSAFRCGEITLHITSDTRLPVELNSFDAVGLNNAVQLNWSTASEQNSSHFDLRRDGALVGRVDAVNSPSGSAYTWTDNGLENGRMYHYALVACDLSGAEAVAAELDAAPEAGNATVTEFALHQNYPNPFNPQTTISFDLPERSVANLRVINALGQEVASLVNGTLEAGRHSISFDATNLPSGLYFYQLRAGDFSELRKMVLMK
ncbi:MAG: T9SS type A sorting domain-containing protein [Calditrichaeota bacterium]|nr:T9SS type A sorting domain-containing protein [Calditrichota bacterium]